MISIRNIIPALKGQLPLKRAFHNFFVTGNAWGLFSKRSHLTIAGNPKVMYNTKASADKSAAKLSTKNKCYYSVYKCIYCNGYHLGRNRDSKNGKYII
jgi:hypothetical protein